MTEHDSILAALKYELDRSKFWGRRNYVSRRRIESIIKKFSKPTPDTISQQPGEWSIRGGNVDAIQHLGGQRGARQVREWVDKRGGITEWMGTYDQEVDRTRVRLDSPRSPNIVGKDWWVVQTADGIFFAVSDADFHIIYVQREDN